MSAYWYKVATKVLIFQLSGAAQGKSALRVFNRILYLKKYHWDNRFQEQRQVQVNLYIYIGTGTTRDSLDSAN
jgi:hypothetical protein